MIRYSILLHENLILLKADLYRFIFVEHSVFQTWIQRYKQMFNTFSYVIGNIYYRS